MEIRSFLATYEAIDPTLMRNIIHLISNHVMPDTLKLCTSSVYYLCHSLCGKENWLFYAILVLFIIVYIARWRTDHVVWGTISRSAWNMVRSSTWWSSPDDLQNWTWPNQSSVILFLLCMPMHIVHMYGHMFTPYLHNNMNPFPRCCGNANWNTYFSWYKELRLITNSWRYNYKWDAGSWTRWALGLIQQALLIFLCS